MKHVRIVSALVLNMYSSVFDMLFSMAMVVAVTLTILARMRVPKMVKNGFNSVSSPWVIYRSVESKWKSGTSTATKRGINTIFDQFQNSHARAINACSDSHKVYASLSFHNARGHAALMRHGYRALYARLRTTEANALPPPRRRSLVQLE